jgi:hypothetical membrane protein
MNAVLIRRLAIASLIGQAAWVAIVTVAGLVEPDYSEVRSAVSELGARTAEHPWIFGVGVAIWGAAFIAAAAALALDGARSFRSLLAPALIAVTGLAQILDGFPFPADCQLSRDAACEAASDAGDLSTRDALHGWIYFIGAIALLLSVFAFAWRVRGDARWGRAGAIALGAGALGLAIFAGLFFATDLDSEGNYGIVQRIALTAGGLWVAAIAIGLLGIHGPPDGRIARFVGRLTGASR